MNNQEELIETEYNRAVNLWNETYSECKLVDLKGKPLSVEPMFDICAYNACRNGTGLIFQHDIASLLQVIMTFPLCRNSPAKPRTGARLLTINRHVLSRLIIKG